MTTHLDELLAERLDDGLSPDQEQGIRRHLLSCVSCAVLAEELQKNDARIARAGRLPDLPPAAFRSRTSHPRWRPGAWVGGVASVLVAVLAVAGAVQLGAHRSAVSASPSPAPASIGGIDRLLFLDRATQALVLVDMAGSELVRHRPGGPVAATTVAVSPDRGSIAFWRGGGPGSELVVMELGSGASKVIAHSGDLIPSGRPCWRTDGRTLLFALVSEPSIASPGAPPAHAQLVTADAQTGSQRTLRDARDAFPLRPVYADARMIAASQTVSLTAAQYLVLDSAGDRVLSQAATPPYAEYGADQRTGAVWGLARNGGSAELRVWRGDRYDVQLAAVQGQGLERPEFDPLHDQLFYAFAAGAGDLRRLDLTTGASTAVLQRPYPIVPRGVGSDGSTVLIERPTQRPPFALLTFASGTATPGPYRLLQYDVSGALFLGMVRGP